MNRLLFSIPFGYFLKTRLNTKSAILFHGYAEYLLGVLFLLYSGLEPLQAVYSFGLAYLAFISVYEIGYIINDFISVKFEEKARKRLSGMQISDATIYTWIIIRIAAFLFLTYYLGMISSATWWVFYVALSAIFALHNVLKRKEYKILTFVSLAVLRFYAPLFPFMETALLVSSINGMMLFYVLFRTLTYIDSKGLLNLPARASFSFKANYYLLLLPLSIVVVFITNDYICLWLNLYFLLFWGAFYLANKVGIIADNPVRIE